MMKIEQTRLAAFTKAISALVPECRLMITPDSWNVVAVDTANVAMVSVVVPKILFLEYGDEKKVEIGIEMVRIKNMLDAMKDPKSTIAIERLQETGRVKVTDGKYTYTLTPLDVNTCRKRPTAPTLALPVRIAVEPKELAEVIKAMGVIGDKVRIAASKAGLTFSTEGDTDHLNKDLTIEDGSTLPEKTFSSLFSLDYLKDMVRVMKDGGTVHLSMSQDHPVRFDFELEGMLCSYLLAPRIEEGV